MLPDNCSIFDKEIETYGAGGDVPTSVSAHEWAKDCNFDPEKLFRKLFHDDVKKLLSTETQLEDNNMPSPLDWNSLSNQAPACSKDFDLECGMLQDQYIWSEATSAQVFALNLPKLVSEEDPTSYESEQNILDFVTACANLRAAAFGLIPLSRFDVEDLYSRVDVSTPEQISSQIATFIWKMASQWMQETEEKRSVEHPHCNKCYSSRCQMHSCPVITCPLSCGAVFHRCKAEEHSMMCCKEEVGCINAGHGCTATMLREKLSDHLRSCPASVVVCKAATGSQGSWDCIRRPCLKLLRRDMFSSHVKDLHDSILNNLVFWLEKCPLTAEGPLSCGPRCPLVWQKSYPDTPTAKIVYLDTHNIFCISYETGVSAESSGRDLLTTLPLELQLHIMEYLDPLSLNCLSKTCAYFKALCEDNFLRKSGIVATVWKKVVGSSGQWTTMHVSTNLTN
ncbi:hypothetical protein B566_EDAN010785 [Ephemera danica]|nr:hypothetical protein B566_EDAN010785 [Ephemera danica]